MKRLKVTLFLSAMMLSTVAGGFAATHVYAADTSFTSTKDVTLESLIDATTPAKMLEDNGKTITVYTDFENTGDDARDNAEFHEIYAKKDGYMEVNSCMSYEDGTFQNIFMTNDPEDTNNYLSTSDGVMAYESEDGFGDSIYHSSVIDITEDFKLENVTEKDGNYIAEITGTLADGTDATYTLTLNPEDGTIISSVRNSTTDHGVEVRKDTFDYTGSEQIDESARDTYNSELAESEGLTGTDLFSSAVDINGNPISEDLLKNAKLVMLNFWEPYCGSCVGEMPDLQKLYEDYKDKGLLIVGVYSTSEEDAQAIVEDEEITYPIIKCTPGLQKYEQECLPGTYFMDGEGNMLTKEPILDSRSYEEWESMINDYMNQTV